MYCGPTVIRAAAPVPWLYARTSPSQALMHRCPAALASPAGMVGAMFGKWSLIFLRAVLTFDAFAGPPKSASASLAGAWFGLSSAVIAAGSRVLTAASTPLSNGFGEGPHAISAPAEQLGTLDGAPATRI